MTTRKVSQG